MGLAMERKFLPFRAVRRQAWEVQWRAFYV